MTKPIEQIKAILKEHDLAGSIAIIDKDGKADYLYHVTPTWSVIDYHITDEDVTVRVKAFEKDYDSKEEQKEAIGRSANILFGAEEMAKTTIRQSNIILDIFRKKFDLIFTCEKVYR